MPKYTYIRWLFLVLLLALLPGVVVAQDEITDDQVNKIAKEIYCPVCESTPLDVCPTLACADWREMIRTQLSEGKSEQEIFDYFARQYGDGVLSNPPRRGISLIVLWILPVLGVGLGLLLFARLMRGLRTSSAAAVPAIAADTPIVSAAAAKPAASSGQSLDDYMARVENELGE